MRIGLYLDADYNKPGGVQEFLKGYYDFLKKRQHTPLIIVPKKEKRNPRNDKRRLCPLGKSIDFSTLGSSASLALTWSENKKIEEFLKREDLDIVHFMAPFGLLGFQLLERNKKLNVATFHITNARKIVQLSLKTIFPLLKKKLDKLDGRIAISPIAYEFAREFFPAEYEIIPPGVDAQRFNPKIEKLKIFSDKKTNILFVGRLDDRKGITYLLEAYAQIKPQYPESRLIIVGTGPKEKQAKGFVKEKKLPDVIFAGFIEDQDIPRYFVSADIFCSPATKDETFGIVLIEAFASGLPTVAFANAGYKTVLRNENAGFLVKNKSVEALAQALLILLTNSRLREALARKNRILAEKKYAWEVVGERILDFYKSL